MKIEDKENKMARKRKKTAEVFHQLNKSSVIKAHK